VETGKFWLPIGYHEARIALWHRVGRVPYALGIFKVVAIGLNGRLEKWGGESYRA
jgi:hypothetical protein